MDTTVAYGTLFDDAGPCCAVKASKAPRKRHPAPAPPALKPLPLFLGSCLHCGGKLQGKGRRRLCRRCYGTAEHHPIRDLYLRSRRGRPLPGTLPMPDDGPAPLPCDDGPLPEDREARILEMQRRVWSGRTAKPDRDLGRQVMELVGSC